jgi:hypothetical protein
MRTNLFKSAGKWAVEVDLHDDSKPKVRKFASQKAAQAFQRAVALGKPVKEEVDDAETD